MLDLIVCYNFYRYILILKPIEREIAVIVSIAFKSLYLA
ncbi:hypothetical protein GXM_03604 [Nostoc sphaeroides CCNUC1]|uniref:Uncharacterized protein n=1 Tax=Nostoc sphaeroides CCNUC1 TaxID=2653204 RepID=A0A5P8W0L9_9NOSO|nr:hypothetical protein GXM_03604 [Nostoc sphaeroides CCNUC1]